MQYFKSKYNALNGNFWLIFSFKICNFKSGLAFRSKNHYFIWQNWVYFIRENLQNLSLKRKWALWMRHQFKNLTLVIRAQSYQQKFSELKHFHKNFKPTIFVRKVKKIIRWCLGSASLLEVSKCSLKLFRMNSIKNIG